MNRTTIKLLQEARSKGYQIDKGGCGMATHWTITYKGQQVACRVNKFEAVNYVIEVTS